MIHLRHRKQFHQDCAEAHKKLLKELAMKWGKKYPVNAIRESYTVWVSQYNLDRNLRMRRMRRRRENVQEKIQKELDALKKSIQIKKELDDMNNDTGGEIE